MYYFQAVTNQTIVLHTKTYSKMEAKEQKDGINQVERLNDIAKRYSSLSNLNYLRIVAKSDVQELLKKENLTKVEEIWVATSYFMACAISKLMVFENILKEK